MMQHRVIMYPMYEETLVVTGLRHDNMENGVDTTNHYTLKTTRAQAWPLPDLLRELATQIEWGQP
jgi:hypothetical protein